MKVSDIMTRDVRLLKPDQTIREAASLMAEINAGALPVSENDRLVGMITDRDIVIRAVAQGRPADTKVADVMSKEMLYCLDTDELDDVARNMGKAQVRRLPDARSRMSSSPRFGWTTRATSGRSTGSTPNSSPRTNRHDRRRRRR